MDIKRQENQFVENKKHIAAKKKSFDVLAELLYENNCLIAFDKLKCELFMLDLVGLGFLKSKQVFVCFQNLFDLHCTGEIPRNVFWISCVDIGPKEKNIVPGHFRENMFNIFTSIMQSGFHLETHLSHITAEYMWFFVLFKRKESDREYFSAILMVVKNHNNLISFEELIRSAGYD